MANDEWVIRKQAQMFVDAGVDLVIFDVANGYHYRDTYMEILRIYSEIHSARGAVPQIAFNTGISEESNEKTMQGIYRDLYSKDKYKDLWFMWRGKPLLLANFTVIDPKYLEFFTVRFSWA